MIIQCKQCRTKFRFDDALMQDEGVWMRCSRCEHVFFQENPQMVKSEMEKRESPEAADEKALSGMKDLDAPTEQSSLAGDEDVARFLDNVMEVKNNESTEAKAPAEEKTSGEASPVKPATEESISEEASEEGEEPNKSQGKKAWKKWQIALWALLVIIIIPLVIYFVVFPDLGAKLIKTIEQLTGLRSGVSMNVREPVRPETVISQVKLQDIRQRMLNNYVLGQIRIVEGTAVNQADYPISRIVIKGEILDAYAVVLGERVSYAGNNLTDEELSTLTEQDIQKRLMQPEGRNNSNDKIMPNGQIPFMIVFIHEPAGAIKTTVVVAGAERLL